MPAVPEKIRTGLVELRTKCGSLYISPSLWERVCLLWTFRNFHSLPRQVLNRREQNLVERLCRTGIVRRAPVTRASVIGIVENVELLPESELEAPTSSAKLVRMRLPVQDAVAPKAVGSEGISISSNRAVRDRTAGWGFRKKPTNVHSIRDFRPYSREKRPSKEVHWTICIRNRVPVWGRWTLLSAFALTLTWVSLYYRTNRPRASLVVTQGATNVSQALSTSTSVSSTSALSNLLPTEKIQHGLVADRTPTVSTIGAALRDREQTQTGPTKTTVSPQPSMAEDELTTSKPRPERLRIREAPTSFSYPIVPDPRLTGSVSLTAFIGRDGTVTTVDVLSGKPALAKAAMRAVKHWRYSTHEVDGNAVEAETNIDINFHGDEVVSVSYPGAQ